MSRSSGSRTASPTSPTTASTAICPSAPTRPRSSGKATIPTKSRHITYAELADEVNRFANVLHAHGVKKGDRVTIYLPMIPEAAYAMLACARIGAIHSVVFGGFSPDAIAGRINDAQSRGRHHRGRGSARRPQGAAEGQCRRGAQEDDDRQDMCWSSSAPAARSPGPRAATSGCTRRPSASRRTARPSR